eukprot:9566284-Alexandrium_andersonii.AAC.1
MEEDRYRPVAVSFTKWGHRRRTCQRLPCGRANSRRCSGHCRRMFASLFAREGPSVGSRCCSWGTDCSLTRQDNDAFLWRAVESLARP